MKTRLFALVLLGWCSAANAQALTSDTLVGWCNDAYAVFRGMSGTPLLHQDKTRSNATACAAYLRGWLEREVNTRMETAPAAQCRAVPENDEMVMSFLKLVHQPGYQPKELNQMMTDFGGMYCPPLPAKTQIAAVLPPPIENIAAPPPATPIVMLPPAVSPVAELPVAPPAAQIVTEPPRPIVQPVLPEVKPIAEAAPVLPEPPLPEPVPVKLAPPPEPLKPVIDPTQTRIISSSQSRMLEADEQSAIQVIR